MLAIPCETCSTSSWTSFAVARLARSPGTRVPGRPTTIPTTTAIRTATASDRDDGDDQGDDAPDTSRGHRRRRAAAPRRSGGRRTAGRACAARSCTIIILIVALFVIAMFVVGIDLWTDAIWYRSVGYDEVFWRRLSRPGRAVPVGGRSWSWPSCSRTLWLAGRLLPPGDGDGGTIRTFIDRLNEAAERSQQARGIPPWEHRAGAPGRAGSSTSRRPTCRIRRRSAAGSSRSSRS